MRRRSPYLELLLTLLLTLLGFLSMGYHPGMEDDGVYLAAVKAALHPGLFPHNAEFFQLQTQATMFDTWMSGFIHGTGMSVAWAELAWQFAALFFMLWAAKKIAAHLFDGASAQWAAVAMVGAMFTLPVAGTALTIADQHLHPRNLATALILLAVWRVLEDRRWAGPSWQSPRWQALVLLMAAFFMHPIMAVLGFAFCGVLAVARMETFPLRLRTAESSVAAMAPLGWIFAAPGSHWREALNTRTYYYLYRWTWYEWLGALAPLLLFWLLARVAEKRGEVRLARFAKAVFGYGVLMQLAAMAMLAPGAPERLVPFQPMRYLQLVYIFMTLAAGGLLGQYVLKAKTWRWAAYLLVFNGSMFLVQWQPMESGAHLELPWMTSTNPWLQTFDWIRANTPNDAYFALDPQYLAAPGEGFHGFRALAERSQLADGIKDTAVVTQVPTLADDWHQQLTAQAGWAHFQLADFERLKTDFGVDWVVVSYPQPAGLDCRWHNAELAACRVP